VECPSIKGPDDQPVRVLCEPIPELEFVSMVEANPGMTAQAGVPDQQQGLDAARFALQHAAAVLGRGTAREVDGALRRPAFSDEELRWVSDADKLKLFATIMKLTGFWTPALQAISFRHENGTGLGSGEGAVGPGEGHGDAAAPAMGNVEPDAT